MKETCVVHLVWSPLGMKHFKRFVVSHKKNHGALDHDLMIVFNGFDSPRDTDEYHDFAHTLELNYSPLILEQPIWDIPAYFAAARSSDSEYVCFLNSYSEPLDMEWLAKMHKWIARADVGLVGATGSYESYYTNQLTHKPPIKSLLNPRSFAASLRARYRRRDELRQAGIWFKAFPNPHLRTNTFMLRRETMLKLKTSEFKTKMDCLKFESGVNSLTAQVEAMNLKTLVIGRDGDAYSMNQWRESKTFRSDKQRNLLVADNQTRNYDEADTETKRLLELYAWNNSQQS